MEEILLSTLLDANNDAAKEVKKETENDHCFGTNKHTIVDQYMERKPTRFEFICKFVNRLH